MLGDLQRVWVYGHRGWSAPQRVPETVLAAFENLTAAGFTHHLVPDADQDGLPSQADLELL